MLTIGLRYREMAHGRPYQHAATPAAIAVLNQTEMEAATAPVPQVLKQLEALRPELDTFFDTSTSDHATIPFHAFAVMSGITAQTNWLGELLLHGEDIARAVGLPWELRERDMLLVARGAMELAHAYLRPETAFRQRVCISLEIPEAIPYIIDIRTGSARTYPRRETDRPDAELRLPASTLIELLYQRIGRFTALRRGLRIVGGRRPWKALQLQSYFERP